jgi:hypothetical protein
MPHFLLDLFRVIWMLTKGHRALALENLALRQQLDNLQAAPQASTIELLRPRVLGLCLQGSGRTGDKHWSLFTPIPLCVGSGSVFDDIGQNCR